MYKVAAELIQNGSLSAARDELGKLWYYALHYGDPAKLALKVGMTSSLNYAQKLEKAAQEQAEEEEIRRKERERREDIERQIVLEEEEALERRKERRRRREEICWRIVSPLCTIGGGGVGMELVIAIGPNHIGGYFAFITWGVLGAIFGFIVILGFIKSYNWFTMENYHKEKLSSAKWSTSQPVANKKGGIPRRGISSKRGISRRVVIEGLVVIAGSAVVSSGIALRMQALKPPGAKNLSWTNNQPIGRASSCTPALVVSKNTLYMAFVDTNDKNKIMLASSKDGVNWTENQLMGRTSSCTPTLAVWEDTLYIAFVDTNNGNNLVFGFSNNGITWNFNETIGQASSQAPTLAVWNATFYLAFVANDYTNDLLIVSSKDGVNWTGTQSVGQASFLGLGAQASSQAPL